jgi:hypothetical protein
MRIVEHIKSNAKKHCFFVNLKNATFWKRTPRGNEIVRFFREMNDNQIIQFVGFFDIFVVGFHNGLNPYVSMTADPSKPNFKHTVFISISKGYKRFTERCSGRATPSIEGDLRSSIGSTPVQSAGFSTSPNSGFQGSSVENAFQQGLSTFEPFQSFRAGPATQPVSPFQGFGGQATQPFSSFQSFGGPVSEFSLFSPQDVSLNDPFVSQESFIPVEPTNGVISRKSKPRLEIRKGRVVSVEIPSGCSSGPSTSSTVEIAKSPKVKTPVSTTIANLEKKIARLESWNPMEGSLSRLELQLSRAKLEKIRNSL